MSGIARNIILILLLSASFDARGQDTERPLPPTLDLVTVEPASAYVLLEWTAGGSPDVAGYIIYLYLNNEGYAIDTIYQPSAVSYTNTDSNSDFYSESYVIAAIDSSDNVSPLSNFLPTIYLEGKLDTCKREITLTWNRYKGVNHEVTEYRIYSSEDGNSYELKGSVEGNDTTFSDETFSSYKEYCYYVEAITDNGRSSLSNSSCLNTDLPVPPEWINADYASINENGNTSLSFTIDPASEYTRYIIERSADTLSGFQIIYDTSETGNRIEFTDESVSDGVWYYRMAAVNSCGENIIYSNIASTIQPELSLDREIISLSWNKYYRWRGGVDRYRIFRNNRGTFEEIDVIEGSDTSYTDYLDSFMYTTGREEICYRLIADESLNPYYDNASSISRTECIEQPFIIHVPNAFTPDGNLVNDFFKPALSFTPLDYTMVIKSRAGLSVFTTKDHLEAWDGRMGDKILPEDVYIWFIEAVTPGGKTIRKNGTVTIIFNRNS